MSDTVAAEKMACMEVWGGNKSTWSSFIVPGLDLWVYSQPYQGNAEGGDVYYLSSCASGRITRILIGDVSGHGSEASPLSTKLRDIMRKNVNYIDQSRVVSAVNDQFEEASSAGRFATALICTYFAPTRKFTVCSAGHPPPLVYRAASTKWEAAVEVKDGTGGNQNLPIGVFSDQDFASATVTFHPGDMFLGYTDALFEARDSDGGLLGVDGLLRVANDLDASTPETLPDQLRNALQALDDGNLNGDDVTIVLARANAKRVSLKDNLLAPVRLIGSYFR